MSQGPPPPEGWPPYEPPREEPGQNPPPPYGQPPYGQQPYPGRPYGHPYGAGPAAPYGVHPATGIPYSDKSKIVAGLLQILIPLGIGRFYIGDTSTGVWQLIVTVLTCGIGALWPFIDGIVILVSDVRDPQGRILRS
jgi:TM2 domain-containing membrane protein YozV